MARSLYGLFWFFVFLAIVNSTIANANAGVNVSSRTAYAMGRIGAFPRFLAQVHPKHHSPALAIVTGFVITVAVTLGLGLGYDPVTAFVMVATALVIVLAAIYIVMNAACIGYFSRASPRYPPVQPAAARGHPGAGDHHVRPGLADRPRGSRRSRSWPRCPRRTPTWAPGWPASWWSA